MKVHLSGSRHFGAEVFAMLRRAGCWVVSVAVPDMEDRLAVAAMAIEGRPVVVPWGARGKLSDLIVTAHSWEIISPAALADCPLGGIGYHPSLLPRHKGRRAVEAAIAAGDRETGGTVYRLTADVDGGPILAQERVAILPGEDAAGLWRRALAPLGLAMLERVVVGMMDGSAP